MDCQDPLFFASSSKSIYLTTALPKYLRLTGSEVELEVVPHTWYHACLGLDTTTARLRVAINGLSLYDGSHEYLNNTVRMKPNTLSDRLEIFKVLTKTK